MKRAIPAAVIGFAGAGVFTYALVHVMKIGTCASGGPYVSARPCPAGTGGWILLLTGGIIVCVIAMIAGAGTGASLLIWSALFLASGVGMLVYALTGHNVSAGAKTAGYTVGGVFIPMGGIPLVYVIYNWFRSMGADRLKKRSKQADATVSRIDELERFGFNQAKVKITYAVQPLDDASFEVSRTTNVLVSQMPHTGQRVKISYDPGNRDKFELVTAGPAASLAMMGAGGTPISALASLAAVTQSAVAHGAAGPGVAGFPTVGPAATAGTRDPLDRLKELAELHSSGVLTDTEFETQKAKILAET
jgi:putative oligomerization/nucleic acid binding protein